MRTYPDPRHYLNEVQKFFFRNKDLHDLRPFQFFRYFTQRPEDDKLTPKQRLTGEDTLAHDPERRVPVEPWHRNYDSAAQDTEEGQEFRCAGYPRTKCASARRRRNMDLCVPGSAFLEPIGAGREKYYEQKLLLNLPWHCPRKPQQLGGENKGKTKWFFTTTAPLLSTQQRSFQMIDRDIVGEATFEEICRNMETVFEPYACLCCRRQSIDCRSCPHAVGWHCCASRRMAQLQVEPLEKEAEDEEELVWRAGSLHAGHWTSQLPCGL